MNLKTTSLTTLAAACIFLPSLQANVIDKDVKNIQKIRFVEDDAQNYMVSKIYELKHQKANDIVPFILGSIKRYAKNGTADRINYAAGNKQFVAVSCPVPLMPYIDDMIAKLDRESPLGDTGSVIEGTGIIRSVYTPKYRSSAKMMDVLVKAGIPSNATEGANQDALVAFDKQTNLIYWKDSIRKDSDMKKYLAWLDRAVPQANITLNVYEVRESDLLDLGMDYLAWKNGPGLNLFEAGMTFLDGSQLASSFGPYGFFMFAPSIDFSFVRILQQNGKAKLASSNSLTLVNNANGSLKFVPGYQNLTKNDKFASSVKVSNNDMFELNLKNVIISLSGETDKDGRLAQTVEAVRDQIGIVNFAYDLKSKNVVERNNLGEELFEESNISSVVSVQNKCERMLLRWTKEQEVEQTIGIPFLSELPVLKYIFGSTTRIKENYFYFLSVNVELVQIDDEVAKITGNLVDVKDLVNKK